MSNDPERKPSSAPGSVSLAIAAIGGVISLLVFLGSFLYTGSGSMGAIGNIFILMVTVPTSLVFFCVWLVASDSRRNR